MSGNGKMIENVNKLVHKLCEENSYYREYFIQRRNLKLLGFGDCHYGILDFFRNRCLSKTVTSAPLIIIRLMILYNGQVCKRGRYATQLWQPCI